MRKRLAHACSVASQAPHRRVGVRVREALEQLLASKNINTVGGVDSLHPILTQPLTHLTHSLPLPT